MEKKFKIFLLEKNFFYPYHGCAVKTNPIEAVQICGAKHAEITIASIQNYLAVLRIWVQTVCKGYQQTTKVAANKLRV